MFFDKLPPLYFKQNIMIMKKIIYLFCFSLILLSCKEKENDPTGDDNLQEQINELQSVISLQNAYSSQKKIVSATSEKVNNIDCWVITFEDNSKAQLPESVVASLNLNESTEEYTIKLSDGQIFIFNKREIVHPTGIVILTREIKFLKNTEVSIEFRVNPSNAVFNYDIFSEGCQIEFE